MLTRIEIDGFKTFERFGLDLEPLTAVVGPNASGKSNLFDALRFLSLLAQYDVRTAMQGLRGEPEELFRRTPSGISDCMSFAVEVLLSRRGIDAFGTRYETPAQRLRYELKLGLIQTSDGAPSGIFVRNENCRPIARKDDRATYLHNAKLNRNARVNPFIERAESGEAILVRQDGRQENVIMVRGTRHSTVPPAPAVRLKRGTVEQVAREACSAISTRPALLDYLAMRIRPNGSLIPKVFWQRQCF